MTDERTDLDALRGTACDLRDKHRGKVEASAAARVSAIDRPENAKAAVERLRVTLERVLDGTIRLEYGRNSEARIYRYWFVAKGRISPTSYPFRVEAAAAMDSLAGNESA
jgi:hypothetical protein